MKKVIQVFSPHFDDAVLSVGQHVLSWRSAGYEVEVITVCTEFETSVLSYDSQDFVDNCGAPNLAEFRKIRANEDKKAMKKIGVSSYSWMGVTDGGFRESNGKPVYRTHNELFSGVIADRKERTKELQQKISSYLKKHAIVIAPLGVGQHADHLLVKECLGQLVPQKQLCWYMDIPYAFQAHNWSGRQTQEFWTMPRSIHWGSKEKQLALDAYATQLPILFPHGMWEYPECVLGFGLK
jgi:LmbE family N-acetylglucosaminyl deacetylase